MRLLPYTNPQPLERLPLHLWVQETIGCTRPDGTQAYSTLLLPADRHQVYDAVTFAQQAETFLAQERGTDFRLYDSQQVFYDADQHIRRSFEAESALLRGLDQLTLAYSPPAPAAPATV